MHPATSRTATGDATKCGAERDFLLLLPTRFHTCAIIMIGAAFFVCERQHGIPISVPDIWSPRKEISVKNIVIVAKTPREGKKSWQKIGDGGRPIEEETSPLLPQKLD